MPLYQTASHYSAPQLLACSAHFLLMYYNEIHDPGELGNCIDYIEKYNICKKVIQYVIW